MSANAFPIETSHEFSLGCERERWLKFYLAQLLKLETDILAEPSLTKDDKASLIPSDQISNARYMIANLEVDLAEYAERAEYGRWGTKG